MHKKIKLVGYGAMLGGLALLACALPVGAADWGRDPIQDSHGRPPAWIHQRAPTTPVATPTGYIPAQIRHAYGFDQLSVQGAGQKIALIEAYGSPTLQNDLNTFCKTFGLPLTTVQIVYPRGRPVFSNSGWALETSFDVEWAHAIAPQATLLVVVAPSDSLTDLLAAVDYAVSVGASQVSMSWGAAEFSTETSYDAHFNHANVTFTAAAGDNGSGVIWPAASPYVLAIGGTTLNLTSSGGVLSETSWVDSGGGKSAYETEPACQKEWETSGKRMVPDVSYNANPNTGYAVYDSTPYGGRWGWFELGGTSAGAPQWAALIALANDQRSRALSQTATPLYYLGSPLMETTYYRDVTSGNNGGFAAKAGYDEVTGLGSPLANKIVPALITY